MGIRPLSLVFATLLVFSTIPYPAAADAPVADAGLDQTVTKGATVELDATGSRDPDGAIQSYEWEITRPDGSTILPDCATCGTTTFIADSVGTYSVRVTVTDDDGGTASDTLYVDVQPGEAPTVVLTGPTTLRADQIGNYTAEATAGDAELKKIVWFVDGSPVETDAIDGDHATAEFTRHFATAGTHDISVRVIDSDGQSHMQAIQTTVQASEVGTGSGDPGRRGSATVLGPSVLTGDGPFSASYSLTGNHIDSVTWWKDGAQIGTGRDTSITFSPGDHRIHARVTYTDGSTGIGRFADGTTLVVVDPAPAISITTLDGIGGLKTDLAASDEYGNLKTFELRLDGAPVLSRQVSTLNLRKEEYGNHLELGASALDIEPGTYQAEILATDARGQQSTISKQVEVVGPPEVLRAGFVERDDLDVYHPRIDPARYTAKYVIEIRLNGANPENIDINEIKDKDLRAVENDYCKTQLKLEDDILSKTSCWAVPGLESGRLGTFIDWEKAIIDGNEVRTDRIHPTPSDPEIRVRVVNGGAGERAAEWGLVIDASGSFDPDRTKLDYKWEGGAAPINDRGDQGKLDSMMVAGLIVNDSNGGQSEFQESFTHHINPPIGSIRQLTSGPYQPNESVRFLVTSESYELPKNSYRGDVDIGLDPSVGWVTEHWTYLGPDAGAVREWHDPDLDDRPQDVDQQAWIVQIPAEAFLHGTPTFETYHELNRNETVRRATFPEPFVLVPDEPYAEDTEIQTQYDVREPTFATKSTVYESIKQNLEQDGFRVLRSELTGQEWAFEHRVKVSDAVYETKTATFGSSGERSVFLDLNPSWISNGSRLTSTTVSRMVTEWRDSRGGDGSFTGQTREVKVQPAEYRVEREYEYQYTTSEVRTRTVAKTYQYPTTVTYQETVRECNRYIGCYEKTVTRTRTVTRTATRYIEGEYTVEVTRTATYWSVGKRAASHTFTGQSRRVLLEAAVYQTQYEYEYEQLETIEDRLYLASETRLVEPAVYEWQEYQSTRSELIADELEATPGVRLIDVQPVPEWTLRKRTGSEINTYSTYSNTSRVEKTHVDISGVIVIPLKNPDSGEVFMKNKTAVSDNFTGNGLVDEEAIIEIYISNWMEGKN